MKTISYIPSFLMLIYGIDALPRHEWNYHGGSRNCKELGIPVTVSANNINIPIPAPEDNIAITDLVLQTYSLLSKASSSSYSYSSSSLSSSSTSEFSLKPNLVSGTYRIGATYCEPSSQQKKSLQILTHGIGFDRSYWDFPLTGGNYSYSYVDNIAHVGHSYGSFLSYGLSVLDPKSSHALVLTGFAHDSGSQSLAPLALHPVTAGSIEPTKRYDLPGYFAEGDPTAAQTTLFAPGQFEPRMLEAVFEASQPFTMGEFLTLNTATQKTSQVTCPVMIVTGERDFPNCGGSCYNTGGSSSKKQETSQQQPNSVVEMAQVYFPNASTFQAEVIKGAGHALNLEFTLSGTYTKIMDFLAQNGFAA